MTLSRSTQWKMAVVALLTAGVVFGSSGLACTTFGINAALSSVDFCFLLDCQNGAFGGLIDPCGSGGLIGDDDRTTESTIVLGPGLADCRL